MYSGHIVNVTVGPKSKSNDVKINIFPPVYFSSGSSSKLHKLYHKFIHLEKFAVAIAQNTNRFLSGAVREWITNLCSFKATYIL